MSAAAALAATSLGLIFSSSVSLQCLYCEKTFRDKTTLRDHMRKKSHRRINASNREYDRFYVINYLVKRALAAPRLAAPPAHLLSSVSPQELGKTWEEVQSEDDGEPVEDEHEEYEPRPGRPTPAPPLSPASLLHRDWSDWRAPPLAAVCLFCHHQSETMELIYAHMEVQATPRPGPGQPSRSERFFLVFRTLTALTCTS